MDLTCNIGGGWGIGLSQIFTLTHPKGAGVEQQRTNQFMHKTTMQSMTSYIFAKSDFLCHSGVTTATLIMQILMSRVGQNCLGS